MVKRTFMDRLIGMAKGYKKEFLRNWALFKESMIGVFGLGIILFFVCMAIFAPILPVAKDRDPMYWSGPPQDYTEVSAYWMSQNGTPLIEPTDSFAKWGSNITPFGLQPSLSAQYISVAYFGSEKGFFAIEPDGGGKPGARTNPGTVGERALYSLPNIGHVVGRPLVNAHAYKNIESYPIEFKDDRVYFSTIDGKVYAYRPEFRNPGGGTIYRISALRTTNGSNPQVYDLGEPIYTSLLFDYVGEGAPSMEAFAYNSETWTMDTVTGWVKINISGPGARYESAMVTAGNRIFLFGGVVKDGLTDDSWVFESGKWVKLNLSVFPSRRSDHAMAYNMDTKEVILFGGRIKNPSSDTSSSETWVFNTENETWSLATTMIAPSSRHGHSMVYDPVTRNIILFGGRDSAGYFQNDTWIYNATKPEWVKISTQGPVPQARIGHAMASDNNGTILLFGGRNETTYFNDTWRFDTSTLRWTLVNVTGPSPRMGHQMVWNSKGSSFILFGGKAVEGDAGYNNDVWEYSGKWVRLNLTGVSPTPRYKYAMAYDPSTQKVVVFGGGINAAWTYDRIIAISERHITKLKDILLSTHNETDNEGRFQMVWRIDLPYRVYSDGVYIASAGIIAVVGDNGKMYGYHVRNGTLAWVANDGKSEISDFNPYARPNIPVTLTAGEWNAQISAVYASTVKGCVNAIHPETGRLKIGYCIPNEIRFWTPHINEAEYYLQVGSSSGYIYEFAAEKNRDIQPGSPLWRFKTQGEVRTKPYSSTHLLSGDAVYALSNDGYAYLLKPIRGSGNASAVMGTAIIELKIPVTEEGGEPNELEYLRDQSGLEVILLSSKSGRIGLFMPTGEFTAPLPPGCYRSGTCYLLGTDFIGRDVLSQLIWGSQLALIIGFLAAFFSVAIALVIGIVAGYFGGKTDVILMRFTDVILVLPGLPLLIVLAAVLGSSIYNLILILAFLGWSGSARIIRAVTLSLKERPFVDAARIAGASHIRIMFKHIAPNVLPLVFLFLTFSVSGTIIAEASLSFIGLGDPTHMSWGMMLYYAQNTGSALKAWWWLIPPGLAITFISLGFFLIGRAFEQIINPRLRRR